MTTALGVYAGTSYSIESSSETWLNSSFHPEWAEYVSALSSQMYTRSEKARQAFIDCLSPFQMLSKIWAVSVLSDLGHLPYSKKPEIVDEYFFIGSWYGQLPVLASTLLNSRSYSNASKLLIDLDNEATSIAQATAVPLVYNCQAVCADAMTYPRSKGPSTCVVWTGVEHFKSDQVKEYIESCKGTGTTFLLQGTDMPAEGHVNLISSLDGLTQYFHVGQKLFEGQLSTKIGTRFMVAYST